MPGPTPVALALGWLVVPAVQYVAAVQRTRVQLGESAPLEWLAALDLTPVYALLLVATLLLGALRAMAAGRRRQPERQGQEGIP